MPDLSRNLVYLRWQHYTGRYVRGGKTK
ncbi:hypothetical protein Gohar_006596 [Gossypium harknessii]|uniref:Uncharacterized protein n=1 Tax=Gossypium harknessii TaxID=34285 RepID=A0A7J9GDX2_9ROSI|nr:hypothetical protein [Gossypium harknessii]